MAPTMFANPDFEGLSRYYSERYAGAQVTSDSSSKGIGKIEYFRTPKFCSVRWQNGDRYLEDIEDLHLCGFDERPR